MSTTRNSTAFAKEALARYPAARSCVTTTPCPPQSAAGRAIHMLKTHAHAGMAPERIAIGDSLVQRWPEEDLDVALGGPVLNLGVGRDRVQNTLWRLQEATWDGSRVITILLWIGTNNIRAGDHVAAIFAGIQHLLGHLAVKAPLASVVVLKLPPFPGFNATESARRVALNDLLDDLPSGPCMQVVALDLLLAEVTTTPKSYEPDRLHLSEAGYGRLAQGLTLEPAGA